MKASFALSSLAVFASSLVSAAPQHPARADKPAAFFLAGDSTTAVGGGWGDGFLTTLQNGAIGTNFGDSGATTASFVAEGYWAKVIATVNDNKASYTPYVTIQFGHNDQKSTSGISVAQFTTNLENLGKAVQDAGGIPVITTSLTRRTFDSNGVVENLAEHSAAAITAAGNIGAVYIDLNKASTAYVNAIGKANAALYNLSEKDYTHLNTAGGVVFGNLVSVLLNGLDKADIAASTVPDGDIAAAIAAGEFILP
ncbi:hypothetical protein V500_05508 [Pseudogymnoascus sp. VKM F-4518 (FW-2643)]|nr:hypothetical protein V500_05508 [Pseudogymnoascus sp. VKM F-4518 (FW-2643)]